MSGPNYYLNLIAEAVGSGDSTHRLPASVGTDKDATSITTTPGVVAQVKAENTTGADIFIALYDTATDPPVPGTTAVKKRLKVKANTIAAYDGLWAFADGIGFAILAANGTDAVAAGAIIDLEIDYRQ